MSKSNTSYIIAGASPDLIAGDSYLNHRTWHFDPTYGLSLSGNQVLSWDSITGSYQLTRYAAGVTYLASGLGGFPNVTVPNNNYLSLVYSDVVCPFIRAFVFQIMQTNDPPKRFSMGSTTGYQTLIQGGRVDNKLQVYNPSSGGVTGNMTTGTLLKLVILFGATGTTILFNGTQYEQSCGVNTASALYLGDKFRSGTQVRWYEAIEVSDGTLQFAEDIRDYFDSKYV